MPLHRLRTRVPEKVFFPFQSSSFNSRSTDHYNHTWLFPRLWSSLQFRLAPQTLAELSWHYHPLCSSLKSASSELSWTSCVLSNRQILGAKALKKTPNQQLLVSLLVQSCSDKIMCSSLRGGLHSPSLSCRQLTMHP